MTQTPLVTTHSAEQSPDAIKALLCTRMKSAVLEALNIMGVARRPMEKGNQHFPHYPFVRDLELAIGGRSYSIRSFADQRYVEGGGGKKNSMMSSVVSE